MTALRAIDGGVVVAALAATMLCACGGTLEERVRETVHRTVATGAAPLVRVENVAGAVRVVAGVKPIVDVTATKYGYDARELHNITMDVRRDRDGVSIVTKYANGVHAGGVRYRITVPASASLQIANVAGSVDLAGTRGNLDVQTQAGKITADAGTVSGKRTIDLRATTGAITLTIAPGSSAVVRANSTVGDFGSDVPGIAQQRQNVVGASGGGTIGSGSALIRLATTTGAITLNERR